MALKILQKEPVTMPQFPCKLPVAILLVNLIKTCTTVITSLCLDTVLARVGVWHLLLPVNCLELTERWSAWSDA